MKQSAQGFVVRLVAGVEHAVIGVRVIVVSIGSQAVVLAISLTVIVAVFPFIF